MIPIIDPEFESLFPPLTEEFGYLRTDVLREQDRTG
jgi:hypothetical protein